MAQPDHVCPSSVGRTAERAERVIRAAQGCQGRRLLVDDVGVGATDEVCPDEPASRGEDLLRVRERLLCISRLARPVQRASDTESRLHPVGADIDAVIVRLGDLARASEIGQRVIRRARPFGEATAGKVREGGHQLRIDVIGTGVSLYCLIEKGRRRALSLPQCQSHLLGSEFASSHRAVLRPLPGAKVQPKKLAQNVRPAAPGNGEETNVISGATVVWGSHNPDVAIVTDSGEIIALSPGNATISATANGVNTQVYFSVLP